ncbi:MAG: response regulator [bacterium]
MANLGRILIADDEETFLHSTADLLREKGYECTCIPDAFSAADLLKKEDFDLLIADIRMPGNEDLELIRQIPQLAEGLPIILITAYPSLKSAMESVQLPVVAYLAKPIDFEQLLSRVRISIEHSRLNQAVRALQSRLNGWRQDLNSIKRSLASVPSPESSVSLATFLDLTFRNIAGAVQDMNQITKSLAAHHQSQEICHLLNCPKLNTMTNAMKEIIDVLAKTKAAFKSKELGDLRRRLEKILRDAAR